MCKTQHLNSSCVWLYYENTIQGFIGSSKSDCSNKLGDSRFVWNQFLNWFLIWTAFIIMNKRATQIKQLQENIKLQKDMSKEERILFTMSLFDISRRTAKEYVDVALYNIQ